MKGGRWHSHVAYDNIQPIPHITKFDMTDHDVGVIAVQYEDGVLDSCGSPRVFTNIVRQDFLRLSIKLPDTVTITRDNKESDTLIIGGVEDDKVRTSLTSISCIFAFMLTVIYYQSECFTSFLQLRAKIASFTAGTLAAFKARGCRM